MPRYHLIACMLLACLLTACGSSPRNEYFRLTANVETTATGNSPALGIGPIEIPAYLDREKMVYALRGNQLQLADTANWAEPLDAGIGRVLALNLSGLLDTQNVRSFPWHPQRAPDYGIRINVLTLGASASEARLTTEWLVYRPASGEEVARRLSRLRRPVTAEEATPAQLPGIYSDLLESLSRELAATIRRDAEAAGSSPAD